MSTKAKYTQQGRSAKRRGISFSFTFEEWTKWWQRQLGPNWESKRGCSKGKFVMARKRDSGGYTVSNVKCILHSQNTAEMAQNNSIAFGEKAGQSKLTAAAVIDIFTSKETYKVLCERHHVCA